MQECGFLRIHHWIFRDRPTDPLYDGPHFDGVLIVIIAGLPWAKRSAWLMPLRSAVASVLQSRGLPAKVLRKKLYFTDEATRFRMRVDFLAAPPRGSSERVRAQPSAPSSSAGALSGTALMMVLDSVWRRGDIPLSPEMAPGWQ